VADGVGHLLLAGFSHEGAGCVGDFGHALYRHLAANRVRHFLVAYFRHHAGAGDRFGDHFGDPFAAAHGSSRALNSNLTNDAGVAGVGYAFFNDWAGNAAGFCNPFTTALLHSPAFCDGLANCVANVLKAGLSFGFPGSRADIAIACLVDGLAHVVADGAVAGLVHGFANGVAFIAIACLVDRLADLAGHVAVARLVDGLADSVGAGFVAGFVDGLADGVAFVSEARFVDVFHAGDWHRFGALVIDGFGACILFLFPNHLLLHIAAL